MKSIRQLGSLLLASAVMALPAAAAVGLDSGFQVLHHEPLRAAEFRTLSPATGHSRLDFQAAGRQWTLLLRPNARMAARGEDGGEAVFEGHLAGVSDSWVRLTRIGETFTGLLHDGSELWVIEPAADVAALAGAGPQTGTAIYRLADTLVDPTLMSCGTVSPAAPPMLRGDLALAVMGGEIARMAQSSGGLFAALPISVVADAEFGQLFGSNAELQLRSRMNNAEGYYRHQLGIAFELREVRLLTSNPPQIEPTAATEMLEGFSSYLGSNSALRRETSLSHLLTGRRLTGGDSDRETLGIAYVSAGSGTGVLCGSTQAGVRLGSRFGAALTAVRRSPLNATLDSLVIAHEIGHNFGAIHDGEEAPCESVSSSGFIMAARLTPGVQEFSGCSIDTMLPFATRALDAGCLLSISAADLGLEVPATALQATIDTAFDVTANLRNLGSLGLTEVRLITTLPQGVSVDTADVGGAACTVETTRIECTVGTLAVDQGASITHRLRVATAGSYTLALVAESSEDAGGGNNQANVSVTASAPAPPPVAPPPAPSSGGGGGGSLGLPALLLLALGLGIVRRRARRF